MAISVESVNYTLNIIRWSQRAVPETPGSLRDPNDLSSLGHSSDSNDPPGSDMGPCVNDQLGMRHVVKS